MIDTIRLIHDIKVIPEEFRFSKTKKGVFSGILNPTREMRTSGKYFPLITITAPYFIKIKIAKTKCYIYCIIHNHYRARPLYEKNCQTCHYASFVL